MVLGVIFIFWFILCLVSYYDMVLLYNITLLGLDFPIYPRLWSSNLLQHCTVAFYDNWHVSPIPDAYSLYIFSEMAYITLVYKFLCYWSIVRHIYNLSPWEVEAGELGV